MDIIQLLLKYHHMRTSSRMATTGMTPMPSPRSSSPTQGNLSPSLSADRAARALRLATVPSGRRMTREGMPRTVWWKQSYVKCVIAIAVVRCMREGMPRTAGVGKRKG